MVVYLEGRNVRPVPLYKQGKQGHFPHLRPSLLQSQKSPPPSSACRVERGQRSAPVAAATTSAVDLPHRLRHASEALEGEGHEGRGRESCEVNEVQRLEALRKERATFPPELSAKELREW